MDLVAASFGWPFRGGRRSYWAIGVVTVLLLPIAFIPLLGYAVAATRAASQDPNGITGFFFQPSDDGKFAVVEFVSRNRGAFQILFNDKTIKIFEEDKQSKASIEAAVKPFRKDFDLGKFAMVMP